MARHKEVFDLVVRHKEELTDCRRDSAAPLLAGVKRTLCSSEDNSCSGNPQKKRALPSVKLGGRKPLTNDESEDLFFGFGSALPVDPQTAVRHEEETCRVDKGCESSLRKGVSFADEMSSSVAIENFTEQAEVLWYSGYAVECDRCDRPLAWGSEGTLSGAPGRSRFSQYQVLCNDCVADRLFTEVGAWLAIGLAANCDSGDSKRVDHPGSVARGPISALFDALAKVGPGAGRSQLSRLLGQRIENTEVCTVVLQKARSQVCELFNRPNGDLEKGGCIVEAQQQGEAGKDAAASCNHKQDELCANGEHHEVSARTVHVKVEKSSEDVHSMPHCKGFAVGGG